MKKFRVVKEVVSRWVYEVEAEDAETAGDLANDGEGEEVDYSEYDGEFSVEEIDG